MKSQTETSFFPKISTGLITFVQQVWMQMQGIVNGTHKIMFIHTLYIAYFNSTNKILERFGCQLMALTGGIQSSIGKSKNLALSNFIKGYFYTLWNQLH